MSQTKFEELIYVICPDKCDWVDKKELDRLNEKWGKQLKVMPNEMTSSERQAMLIKTKQRRKL